MAAFAVTLLVSCGGDDDTVDGAAEVTTTRSAPTSQPTRTQTSTTASAPTTQPATTTTRAPITTLSSETYYEVLARAEAVCRGAAMAEAAVYDPDEPGPHPVLVFAGNHPDYGLYELLPEVPLAEGWNADLNKYSEVELVTCVDGRDGLELAQVCEVSGEPGRSVEIYDAAGFNLTLRVAATGEAIATGTVDGSEPEECPISVIFSGDQEVVRLYTVPSAESLSEVLAPLVAP